MKLTRAAGLSGIVLGIAALLTLSGCNRQPRQDAASPPTLFQFEDYMDPPFLAQYKKQFNETPDVAIYADEDEAFAKMRAGYKPDVMGPCFYEFPRWQDAYRSLTWARNCCFAFRADPEGFV